MTRANNLLQQLVAGDVLISDGATGTYLQSHGLEPGGCPEEMNSANPEVIRAMASDYFVAGADMVLTNTFGGTSFMLKKYGHGDRVAELNMLGAQHARSQSSSGQFVAGSIGPTGELLESNSGTTPDSEVYDAFVEQVTALEAGGGDSIDIETMISVEEASLAIKAAKEYTNLVVISTMMFTRGPRGWFTMMGDTPEDATKKLRATGADVVGANCGSGIDDMVILARELRNVDSGHLLIHSNAGTPEIRKGQIVYPENPEFMAPRFQTLIDIGINIVGGCCGTTPAHIKALSETIRKKG